ncbi:MAG: sigma 54-interacting transcriptional regulator [Bacillota bacterium]|nr:sigma 54-interacting transcriptional regulator [Bacillota bacterium]MDW7678351.1 sigma 54-interacting transcriptional regulator [Bacillota bacterium]
MPNLTGMRETTQQVAEAISLAVGLETEIVDHELTIVGGTGPYSERLGEKEELGKLESNFLYARVLREGKTVFVKEALSDLTYDPLTRLGKRQELAEICTPIISHDKIIGVIGLVAFTKEQHQHLLIEKEKLKLFVERMAELLGAKASEIIMMQKMQQTREEMATILETIHEGMLAVNSQGIIEYCNANAALLLKKDREELVGQPLQEMMPGTPALDVLETGEGYTEQEEILKTGTKYLHFIVTTRPIFDKKAVRGLVVSFRDIIEARKLVYNLSEMSITYTFDDIIGNSEKMQRAKTRARQVALGNSTVLITGESGTGKELFARAIHYASDRRNGPFITVNCGAIPETLLESELFGYEKGAFTGARDKGKAGKFELADSGTIFLDEIGDMPLHLQVKLLHVLQNRRFERVGGNKTIQVDVRVITATNRNLEEMMREKLFREDLYYRISVIPLLLPPLRERREDILELSRYFLKKYNGYMNKNIKDFSPEVQNLFLAYGWPGNVRELENAVEYGVNMSYTDQIHLDTVPPKLQYLNASPGQPLNRSSLQEQLKSTEKDILIQKIREHGSSHDSKLVIARELGVSRATLYRKLAEHDMS